MFTSWTLIFTHHGTDPSKWLCTICALRLRPFRFGSGVVTLSSYHITRVLLWKGLLTLITKLTVVKTLLLPGYKHVVQTYTRSVTSIVVLEKTFEKEKKTSPEPLTDQIGRFRSLRYWLCFRETDTIFSRYGVSSFHYTSLKRRHLLLCSDTRKNKIQRKQINKGPKERKESKSSTVHSERDKDFLHGKCGIQRDEY